MTYRRLKQEVTELVAKIKENEPEISSDGIRALNKLVRLVMEWPASEDDDRALDD